MPIPKKKGLESKFCWDRVEGVSPLEEDKFLSFQAPFLQTLGEADLSRCLNFLLDAHPKRHLHAYSTCNQWSWTKQGVTQFAKANTIGSYHLNYLLGVSAQVM